MVNAGGLLDSGGPKAEALTATAAANGRAPHAVLVPYPVQGHINPMTQLAEALAQNGIRVTMVHNHHNYTSLLRNRKAADANPHSNPLYQSVWIDNGLPPDFDYTNPMPRAEQFHQGVLNMEQPFRELLLSWRHDQSASATCVVFGVFCHWASHVASELGIPSALFWTQSAAVYDIYYHLPLLESRGFFPYSQFTRPGCDTTSTFALVDYIPGIPPLHPEDLPTLLHLEDSNNIHLQAMKKQVLALNTYKCVIVNSFYELEREACDVLHSLSSSIYLVGPLIPPRLPHDEGGKATRVGASLHEETTDCITWLDKQKKSSVLYVSFGSMFQISPEECQTIASGLKASEQPFLWVIKTSQNLPDAMLKSFLEETKDFGLVVPWAPQVEVLSHSSIGAFLSHCGWNSTLESIALGVPILPYPILLDQTTNGAYVNDVWKVGVKFGRGLDGKVTSEEVARVVRMALCEEEGRHLKERASKLKEVARNATKMEGSSGIELRRLVQALKCTS